MSYEEVIFTERAGWESEAEQFALRRLSFVVVGWQYSFDNDFCTRFAQRHGYRYRFDPDKDRAFLDPIPGNSSQVNE